MADGNTVLLVEDTLFKVHRSILIKDLSTFDNMFSLDTHKPDGVHGQEGDSDENPIRLQGDTVYEFRALLWSLYSLPPESELVITSATLARFCNLGRIAHKYQYQTIGKWALDKLTTYTSCQLLVLLEDLDSALVPITELAVLSEHCNLLTAVTAKWKFVISVGEDLGLTIVTTERLGLRGLLGLAYHSMMLKGRDYWKSDPFLTRTQRIRLLSGHYTLIQKCEALPSEPPMLRHNPLCVHQRCALGWKRLWRMITSNQDGGLGAQVLVLHKADLLGKMLLAKSVLTALVEGQIPMDDPFQGMHDACIGKTLEATTAQVKEVQDHLTDMFTDVE